MSQKFANGYSQPMQEISLRTTGHTEFVNIDREIKALIDASGFFLVASYLKTAMLSSMINVT